MNPRAEFVKAIMSVLRLESNIYTTGAIETIIERLEVTDYQLFIAYLGERKSDYEKPIENVAKGVEEFFEIKLKPYKEESEEIANKLYRALHTLNDVIRSQSEHESNSTEHKAEIEKEMSNFAELNENAIVNKRHALKSQQIEKISINLEKKVESRKSEFFNNYKTAKTKERVISKKEEDILFSIGGFNGLRQTKTNNPPKYIILKIQDILLRYIYKPSIAEKIYLSEKNNENIVAIDVRDKISGLISNNKENEQFKG